MDKETDEKLDEFTGKLLNQFSSETPSFDFTKRVMSRVEDLSKSRAVEYKPLISKESWMFLGVVVASVFLYLIFGNLQMESSWLSSFSSDWLWDMSSLIKVQDLKMSNVLLYGVLGFTFFAGIQILMLKHHFNQRLR